MKDSSSRVCRCAGGPLVSGGTEYSKSEYASCVDLPLVFMVMPSPIAGIWVPLREASMYPPPRLMMDLLQAYALAHSLGRDASHRHKGVPFTGTLFSRVRPRRRRGRETHRGPGPVRAHQGRGSGDR